MTTHVLFDNGSHKNVLIDVSDDRTLAVQANGSTIRRSRAAQNPGRSSEYRTSMPASMHAARIIASQKDAAC